MDDIGLDNYEGQKTIDGYQIGLGLQQIRQTVGEDKQSGGGVKQRGEDKVEGGFKQRRDGGGGGGVGIGIGIGIN